MFVGIINFIPRSEKNVNVRRKLTIPDFKKQVSWIMRETNKTGKGRNPSAHTINFNEKII